MKTVIIIPARYNSTRLPGKPLLDINGKPMIWWVYNRCIKVNNISQVIVATDDSRIEDKCNELGIASIMTDKRIATPNDRAYEVSKHIDADYYIVVNGDEPLISIENISRVLPSTYESAEKYFCCYAITEIKNPSEVIDFSNTKVVFNEKNMEALWISRSPIPYPKGALDFSYFKMLGIACFSKNALSFYGETERSRLEMIEEIDPYRFIENGIKIHLRLCESEGVSVDTVKDLELVRELMRRNTN